MIIHAAERRLKRTLTREEIEGKLGEILTEEDYQVLGEVFMLYFILLTYYITERSPTKWLKYVFQISNGFS